MGQFVLKAPYTARGDQPQAIEALAAGVQAGMPAQVLLGVTGSGKTFTMASVIEKVQRPTLVIAHNKTLAAQLCSEFKAFFPDSAVEYFVSYYDYYQPEAYIPSSDTYIEKDASVNEEIDRLRHSATAALKERSDVIIVASVSCIYSMGDPSEYEGQMISLRPGMEMSPEELLRRLVEIQYERNDVAFERGNFRVRGDTVEIIPAGQRENGIRVEFFGDEIDRVAEFSVVDGHLLHTVQHAAIFPATHYATSVENREENIAQIERDMYTQKAAFEAEGKLLEAQRIEQRTKYDVEMLREIGFCNGIENYSRYFDGRKAGERPYCLLDFFPKDYLMIIDESHVSVPQIRAMYGGDRARKTNLVEYGFRLPAAFDNRPLTFEEFHEMINQVIYVSATPADYELEEAEGVVVEQVIRPTGLLDPEIEVRKSENQIDDLMDEILTRSHRGERVLVTTLTKRMAEELSGYLLDHHIATAYIHSDVSTLDRVKILNDLRQGTYDVLVGVNLLREGLDLPEVSLVAIIDADKEGFLRNHRSLTQTAGRAARNVNGKVIMYADTITASMQLTIDETLRRRTKQIQYNEAHGITPTQIKKNLSVSALQKENRADTKEMLRDIGVAAENGSKGAMMTADPIIGQMTREQLQKLLLETTRKMKEAAKQLDFLQAAQYRDEVFKIQQQLDLGNS